MWLRAILAVLFTLSAPAAYVVHFWLVPALRVRDVEWWASASRCERVITCRRVLSSPVGSYHDAALEVGRLGDTGAVPHLIDSLRWETSATCTNRHIRGALRGLTGVDAGRGHEQWAQWWEEHKHDPRWRAGCTPQTTGN